jgi:hypothetical protein
VITKIVSTEESLRLSCEINQYVYPTAKVVWYKLPDRVQLMSGEIFNKTKPKMNDNGLYVCEARNHPTRGTNRKFFYVNIFSEIIQSLYSLVHFALYTNLCFSTSSLSCHSS